MDLLIDLRLAYRDASCFYLKKSQGFRLLTCANVSARAFGGSRFGRENVLVRWLSRGNGS